MTRGTSSSSRPVYDAIVVGGGAAGGYAVKSLTDVGLRVLLLDAGWRGPALKAVYQAAVGEFGRRLADPTFSGGLPEAVLAGARTVLYKAGSVLQPVQERCYAWELDPDSFVDDRALPYEHPGDAPFTWIRSRRIGGRMLTPGHGRQHFRMNDDVFGGHGNPQAEWPIRYADIERYYDQVEADIRLSVGVETSPDVPPSRGTNVRAASVDEADLMQRLKAHWPDFRPILGSTAPWYDGVGKALSTGRLTVRRGAAVHGIDVHPDGRVRGVAWREAESGVDMGAEAPLVFLCASTIETTRILMMSRSDRHPDGIGARSNALGRFLMDHVQLNGEGSGPPLADRRRRHRPEHCVYAPRLDRRTGGSAPFGAQIYRTPSGPGGSQFLMTTFAEMEPRAENHVRLNPSRLDAYGMPTLYIECRHSAADLASVRAQKQAIQEVSALADVALRPLPDAPGTPGSSIHECGTARMGSDPATSVLNPHNETWDVAGLFVTDGACFPSQGAQNPTLTIMALTARACDHAVKR